MGCACSDNKKLNNNKKLDDLKTFRLEDMKNIPIDKIVDLYRDGYRLENSQYNTQNIENNYRLDSFGNNVDIKSLGCSGSPTTDIYRPMDQQGGIIIYKGTVGACKITPTSRCLDVILFIGARQYSTSYSLYFEIRENDPATNLPKGIPGNATGLIKQVTNTFETSFTSYPQSVDILAELPAANVPYWITIRSSDYVCGGGTTGYERVELSYSFLAGNIRATYGPVVPCGWTGGVTDSWAMEVFKTTYTTPSNAQIFNVCWGPGLGDTCSIPPEEPVIQTGTNFTIKADVSNSGSTGPVRAVFKANNTTISTQDNPSLATFPGGGFWSPTVNYTMPSTDVTLVVEGYGWNGTSWSLTNTYTVTISKSTPTCTGISIDADTVTANVGDTIILSAYGITPTTQSYTVTFTDRSNAILGTCNSSNGMCSIDWDTTGLTSGIYYVKAAVIGQCTSTELAIGLSMPIVQWDVDIYVKDSITTNPIQGASITIGTQTLTTDENGYRRFRVDQGTIDVTIVKTGYNTIGPIPESVYNNTILNYDMNPVSQNPGSLRFITSPPGISSAEVHFIGDDPTLKGTTDVNGIFTIGSLTAGRVVNYQVIKTGYNIATGSATVVGNITTDVIVTMTLLSTTGSVCIHSNPSGASIKIDNTTRAGKSTALSGGGCIETNTVGNLSSGNHNYELSLAGHQNKTGYFSITVGQTLDYDAGVLSPLPNLGTLNISSSPSGARIYIMSNSVYVDTGYVTGTSGSPTVITTLTAGTYSYKLTLFGYQDYSSTFAITTGQTTIVNPTLTVSSPTTGGLSIASYPDGAKIYVEISGTFEDMLYITGPIGNPTIISNLEEGAYRYKLTYPDYPDSIGDFTVTAGEITGPINVTMTRPSTEGGTGILFGLLGIGAFAMMLSSSQASPTIPKYK